MRILLSDYPPEVFSHERFSSGLDCSNIAGIYGNGAATINFDKGHLHGKWNKNSRPDFKGTIEANCRGKMLFPDHRVFTLEYDPKLKKIFWDGRTSGNVWTKGIRKSQMERFKI